MNTKFAIYIYFTFILFTVIGTLTHEFGHFIVGRYLGYQTKIHYGFTSSNTGKFDDKLTQIYLKNKEAILAKEEFIEKKQYESLLKVESKKHFFLTLGGPAINILIGSIGFVLILWIRKQYLYASTISHWICLFLTFFWMRQPTNLVVWVLKKPINLNNAYRGDEIKLAQYLNLPLGSIIWITGILGLLICGYAIVKFIPKDRLLTFLVSGFLGGISGIILWLKILGPIILP